MHAVRCARQPAGPRMSCSSAAWAAAAYLTTQPASAAYRLPAPSGCASEALSSRVFLYSSARLLNTQPLASLAVITCNARVASHRDQASSISKICSAIGCCMYMHGPIGVQYHICMLTLLCSDPGARWTQPGLLQILLISSAQHISACLATTLAMP